MLTGLFRVRIHIFRFILTGLHFTFTLYFKVHYLKTLSKVITN